MSRYIYHYLMERQTPRGFENMDGLLLMDKKIANHNNYRELKKLIVDEVYNGEDKSIDRWVVKSLSFHGME